MTIKTHKLYVNVCKYTKIIKKFVTIVVKIMLMPKTFVGFHLPLKVFLMCFSFSVVFYNCHVI